MKIKEEREALQKIIDLSKELRDSIKAYNRGMVGSGENIFYCWDNVIENVSKIAKDRYDYLEDMTDELYSCGGRYLLSHHI